MGRKLIALAHQNPLFSIGAGIASSTSPSIGCDLGQLGNTEHLGIPLAHSLTPALDSCDLLIDFSHSSTTSSLLDYALEQKKPLVIGTTGYDDATKRKIHQAAERIPLFYSANFSLGICAMQEALRLLGSRLKDHFSVRIVEKHHRHKKDAPSGTALSLALELPASDEVEISSIREGETAGEHTVIFYSEQETIECKHSALSRGLFAQGALLAAAFLSRQPAGFYQMHDLFGGSNR